YSSARPPDLERRSQIISGDYLPSVAADGTLLCAPLAPRLSRVVLLDRQGQGLFTSQAFVTASTVSLSPDTNTIPLGTGIESAISTTSTAARYEDVWALDRQRGTLLSVTSNHRGGGHTPLSWIASDEMLVYVLAAGIFYSIRKDGSPGRISDHRGERPNLSR